MKPAALAALALLSGLGACATVTRYDAAGDIHAFLVAVRNNDRAGFEAHVDRPALRAQIETRVMDEMARAHGPDSPQAIGAALAAPLVGAGVDLLVQPATFRAAAAYLGYGPERPIPGRFVIGEAVKPMGSDRICVLVNHACGFVFTREGDAWKLTAFEGDLRGMKGR